MNAFRFEKGMLAKCLKTGFTGDIVERQRLSDKSILYRIKVMEHGDPFYISQYEDKLIAIEKNNNKVNKMDTFKFNLGCKVHDVISQFTGVITARCEYTGEINSYRVEKVRKGKIVSEWINENRLRRSED